MKKRFLVTLKSTSKIVIFNIDSRHNIKFLLFRKTNYKFVLKEGYYLISDLFSADIKYFRKEGLKKAFWYKTNSNGVLEKIKIINSKFIWHQSGLSLSHVLALSLVLYLFYESAVSVLYFFKKNYAISVLISMLHIL
jgi:hypothetical protein